MFTEKIHSVAEISAALRRRARKARQVLFTAFQALFWSFFYSYGKFVGVDILQMHSISYFIHQKWVPDLNHDDYCAKSNDKMVVWEGNWVPWHTQSMELNKQFTYTNVKIMKTMELLANFTIFFTTKKIWRLQDKWYAHKKILKWRCQSAHEISMLSSILVL